MSEVKQRFEIQRLYVKDISFESPSSPQIFLQEWKPEIKIDINVEHTSLDNDLFEITLLVTATAEADKKVAFIAEVKQAGIFQIAGFEGEQQASMLGAFCPGILFPYAREVISDIVNRGSFPQLNLAPINFDAFYQQQKQAKSETEKNAATETKH